MNLQGFRYNLQQTESKSATQDISSAHVPYRRCERRILYVARPSVPWLPSAPLMPSPVK